jgi:hypothetical protein
VDAGSYTVAIGNSALTLAGQRSVTRPAADLGRS